MICQLPPKKKNKKDKKVSWPHFFIVLCFSALFFIAILPGDNLTNHKATNIQETVNSPKTFTNSPVDEQIFINFYGEPKIYDIKTISAQDKLISLSSNGIYEVNFKNSNIKLFEPIGFDNAQITSFDFDLNNSVYFLGSTKGLVIYFPLNKSALLFNTNNSDLLASNIQDIKFLSETNQLYFVHGDSAPGLGIFDINSYSITYVTEMFKLTNKDLFFHKILTSPSFGTFLISNSSNSQIIKYNDNKKILMSETFRFSNIGDDKLILSSQLDDSGVVLFLSSSGNLILWNIREKIIMNNNLIDQTGKLGSIESIYKGDDDNFILAFSYQSFFSDSVLIEKHGGLMFFNWKTRELSKVLNDELNKFEIHSVVPYKSRLVLGTDLGLYIVDTYKNTLNPYYLGDDYGLTSPKTLTFSKTSKLLYIAGIEGIVTYDQIAEKLSPIKIKLNFPSAPEITALAAGAGKLFIGTSTNDLYIYDEFTGIINSKTYNFSNMSSQRIIAMSFHRDRDNLYLVNEENNLIIYDIISNTFTFHNLSTKVSKSINSLSISNSGQGLLFTTDSSVFFWDLDTENLVPYYDSPTDLEFFTSVVEDEHGRLFMGSRNNLVQYDRNKDEVVKTYNSENGLKHSQIHALELTEDYLFIGTEAGLSIMKIHALQDLTTTGLIS